MQRSFVAKSTVNFPDFELYVRIGDILVYNAANDNSLTIYRGGAIVKTIKTTPISIAVLLKTKMVVEMAQASKPTVVAPPKPSPAPKVAVKPKSVPKPKSDSVLPDLDFVKVPVEKMKIPKAAGLTAEEFTPAVKRGKAQPKEVEMPERLKEALENFPPVSIERPADGSPLVVPGLSKEEVKEVMSLRSHVETE